MSYKPVVVALRRDRGVGLEQQIDGILRPFMYDPALPDEDSRCDAWSVGGRWAGHFLSVHRGEPDLVNRLAFPRRSLLSTHIACDGGPKGLLDLDFLLTRAEEEVWRRWPVRFHERLDDILSGRDLSNAASEEFHAATAALISQHRDALSPGPLSSHWRGSGSKAAGHGRRARPATAGSTGTSEPWMTMPGWSASPCISDRPRRRVPACSPQSARIGFPDAPWPDDRIRPRADRSCSAALRVGFPARSRGHGCGTRYLLAGEPGYWRR